MTSKWDKSSSVLSLLLRHHSINKVSSLAAARASNHQDETPLFFLTEIRHSFIVYKRNARNLMRHFKTAHSATPSFVAKHVEEHVRSNETSID